MFMMEIRLKLIESMEFGANYLFLKTTINPGFLIFTIGFYKTFDSIIFFPYIDTTLSDDLDTQQEQKDKLPYFAICV